MLPASSVRNWTQVAGLIATSVLLISSYFMVRADREPFMVSKKMHNSLIMTFCDGVALLLKRDFLSRGRTGSDSGQYVRCHLVCT